MEILIIGLGLYILPSMIALLRQHNNVNPIFIINLFLGWTLIGWVGALAWSFTGDVKQSVKKFS